MQHLAVTEEIDPDRLYEMCLAHIGSAILTCQTLEASLRECVDHWFPQNAGMERDQLDFEKRRLGRATLGRLMKKFAEYEPLPDDFDELLVSVLKRRNKLAHDFYEDFVNSNGDGKWQIIADCIQLILDARSCREVVRRRMIDAQIAAFERTSEIMPKTSKVLLDHLEEKRFHLKGRSLRSKTY